MNVFKFKVLLLIGVTSSSAIANAQLTAPLVAPYSYVTVRASVLGPASIGRLSPHYSANAGGMLEAETPFNIGNIGVTVGWLPMQRKATTNSATGNSNEDFRALIMGVDWRTRRHAFGPLHAAAGARVATFRMAFSDTLVDRGIRTEDELLVGITTNVVIPITQQLHLSAGGSWSRVMLHVPLYISTISAGVEWKFPLPARVGEWFR